jgi:hypothetical protein
MELRTDHTHMPITEKTKKLSHENRETEGEGFTRLVAVVGG